MILVSPLSPIFLPGAQPKTSQAAHNMCIRLDSIPSKAGQAIHLSPIIAVFHCEDQDNEQLLHGLSVLFHYPSA